MAAAAQFQLNDYLDEVLNITSEDVRTALNNQGLTNLADFISLTEDDVGEICSIARKPGGVVPNPVYNRNNHIPGVPATIANPGVLIGHIYEKRLKMLRYYMHHLQRIQRVFNADEATLPMLTDIYKQKEQEDNEEDIDLPEKLTSVDKVRSVLENIDDYLVRKTGATKVPLAYVTRMQVTPELVNDDGLGQPTHLAEMIRRAPHIGIAYNEDNHMVWDMIRHVTHDGPGWSWVQAFQRERDGRSAYMSIKTHYMGESFTARLRAKADKTMEGTFYDGKSRTFTFERFCETLQSAFTDITSTGEIISEPRKIRVLLNGITDPRLEVAKSQILATPTLNNTFEYAVNFVARYLDDKRSYNAPRQPQRNISVAHAGNASPAQRHGQGGRGGGFGGRGGRGGRHGRGGRGGRSGNEGKGRSNVTDKYYNPQEWSQLSSEDQARVRELRAERDRRRNVQSADTRNVRQRTEDVSVVTTPTVQTTPPPNTHTVSTVTSQRSNRNF